MKKLVLIFLFVSTLFAHKINLFITHENDTIDIYSYFANGAPCKNCKLIIKNDEKIILEDNLTRDGKYKYIPQHKNIEVIVDASAGHIVKEQLVIENIKQKDIRKYQEDEKNLEYQKIILGLAVLFIFFFLLKRFKR